MPAKKLDMPKNNNTKKDSVRKGVVYTSKEYASVTTAHGFSYIADENYSGGDRILWVIIVLLAFGFTIFQMTTLYTDWQENPVITTLDTVALPIEDIEFPAITICPQGSLQDIWDSVLFNQLKSYIYNKTLGVGGRKKRTTNSKYRVRGLTYEEMMLEAEKFLNDNYPGINHNDDNHPMPTSMLQLMRLMISDDPERMLQNEVVLFPNETCNPECNMDILDNLNQQLRNQFCPEGFQVSETFECIHVKQQEMTYDEATEYCQSLDNSNLLYMDSSNDFDTMDELITGTIHVLKV